ncbi:MAG: SPOR domain-containing protein [Rhodobacteraceae bacterium]|nr:SPOR domain-containing protein [Paracoccaceae bacterium]
MQLFRVVSAAVVAAVMAGGLVIAQPVSQVDGPRELPPADYKGTQYVDSAGCVFLRAGVGGKTVWVPRVTRDRTLVCGQEPTFPPGLLEGVAGLKGGAAPAAPAPEAAPAAPVAEAAGAEAPAAKPAPAAAKAAAPKVQAKPAPVPAAILAGPVRLVRSYRVAQPETLCTAEVASAQRFLLSDGRRVTRCAGDDVRGAVGYLNGLGIAGLAVAEGAPSAAEAARAERADKGAYRVVWTNGVVVELPAGPGGAARPAPAATAEAAKAPAAMRPAATGGHYVQVGVFADPANAARAIARLKSMGLTVSSATGQKGGHPVKAVMAGPFASAAEQQAALAALRRAGYGDAYAR